MASNNVEKVMALLRGVSSGDADLATRDVSPDGFVQHDPLVADGVVGLRAQASRSAGDGSLEIIRVLQDGPFVVAHGRDGADDGGEVFFAVFRFENGLLVEHWRFAAPAAPPNESGHTQTDGTTEPDGADMTRPRRSFGTITRPCTLAGSTTGSVITCRAIFRSATSPASGTGSRRSSGISWC